MKTLISVAVLCFASQSGIAQCPGGVCPTARYGFPSSPLFIPTDSVPKQMGLPAKGRPPAVGTSPGEGWVWDYVSEIGKYTWVKYGTAAVPEAKKVTVKAATCDLCKCGCAETGKCKCKNCNEHTDDPSYSVVRPTPKAKP